MTRSAHQPRIARSRHPSARPVLAGTFSVDPELLDDMGAVLATSRH